MERMYSVEETVSHDKQIALPEEHTMVPEDPRNIEQWDEINETIVAALSPIQLIAYIHHRLRQKAAVTAGWGQLLAQGVFGFASQEQQDAIELLQTNIVDIEQIRQDIDRWLD